MSDVCDEHLQAKLDSAQKAKWLLVNIQDVQEFDCQVLNRDVWNNPVVAELVKANFLFWQVCKVLSTVVRFTSNLSVISGDQ